VPLTAQFLDELGRTLGRAPAGITHETKAALLAHRWPGNVRELRNVLERAAILADGGLIAPEHLAIAPARGALEIDTVNVGAMERRLIERALRDTRGNKSRAAAHLGLSRKQLYHRLARYGID